MWAETQEPKYWWLECWSEVALWQIKNTGCHLSKTEKQHFIPALQLLEIDRKE